MKKLILTMISLFAICITQTQAWPESPKDLASLQIDQLEATIYGMGYLKGKNGHNIAQALYFRGKQHKIDPRVMVAIIAVESSFRQDAVSPTGDISLAQINPKTWGKEFKRLKRSPLDSKLTKSDETYAIDRLGEILSILKSNHKHQMNWFGYYHSKTPSLRDDYSNKILQEMAQYDQNLANVGVLWASR